MGITRVLRGMLLGIGLLGMASWANAQDWGPDKDVVITTPVTITPTGTLITYSAQSLTATNGGQLDIPSYMHHDSPIYIAIGEGRLRLEDGVINTEATRFNSMGNITQTGGTLNMGGNMSTGLAPDPVIDTTQATGNFTITGGDFSNGGGIIAGVFSASGSGKRYYGDIFASQAIRIQSDDIRIAEPTRVDYDPDQYGVGIGGFEGMSVLWGGGEDGAHLSGTLYMEDYSNPLFSQYGATPQEFAILKSMRFTDNWDGISFVDQVDPHGTLNAIGDLTVVGRTTDNPSFDNGMAMPIVIASEMVIHDGVTLTADANKDLAWTGKMTFNPGSKLEVNGTFTLLSYQADHIEDDGEGWIMTNGQPIGDFRLDAEISAAPGNEEALIRINQGGQIGFGWLADMEAIKLKNMESAFQTATLTLSSKTVFLLDYNTITGNGVERESQLDLAPGGNWLASRISSWASMRPRRRKSSAAIQPRRPCLSVR